jgi:hypothetical protein
MWAPFSVTGPRLLPPSRKKRISSASADRHISTLQKSPAHGTGGGTERRRRHGSSLRRALLLAGNHAESSAPPAGRRDPPKSPRSGRGIGRPIDRSTRRSGASLGQVSSSGHSIPFAFLLARRSVEIRIRPRPSLVVAPGASLSASFRCF